MIYCKGEIFEVTYVNTDLINVLLLNSGNLYEQHSSCQYRQEFGVAYC